MDALAVLVAILVWLLVLGAALMRVPGTGVRSLIAPWLILSVLTMGCLFIVLFIVTYGLLFTAGPAAATIGFVVSAIILGATPVAWAVYFRRRARRASAEG